MNTKPAADGPLDTFPKYLLLNARRIADRPAMRTEIEISQEELGLLAGVSRPVVNKALQELEDEGLLRVDHGRITVFDLEKLSRFGPD